MIVAISLISGVTDVYALLAVAGCNFAMILFGYMSDEARIYTGRWLLPWAIGGVVGIVPWVIIFTSIGRSGLNSATQVGALVISMTVITFLFFMSFAAVSFYYSWYFVPTEAKRKSVSTTDDVNGNKTILNPEAGWDRNDKKGSREIKENEELWYAALSTLSKSTLAWLVFLALYQGS